jgi:hypothetical protein
MSEPGVVTVNLSHKPESRNHFSNLALFSVRLRARAMANPSYRVMAPLTDALESFVNTLKRVLPDWPQTALCYFVLPSLTQKRWVLLRKNISPSATAGDAMNM